MTGFSAFAFLFLALCIYLLPTIIGVERKHPSAGGIFVINLFFGWTLLGWVIALAWSVSGIPANSNR